MKKYFITGTACLIIGAMLGAGGIFLYNKKQTDKLENGIVVKVIEGESGNIKHEKIKNYPDRIEFITEAKKPGKIKTIIKKELFCPKTYKNSLSFIVYGGVQDSQPDISYGIEYRRQIFSKAHILTGMNTVNGFKIFVGAGVNF